METMINFKLRNTAWKDFLSQNVKKKDFLKIASFVDVEKNYTPYLYDAYRKDKQ